MHGQSPHILLAAPQAVPWAGPSCHGRSLRPPYLPAMQKTQARLTAWARKTVFRLASQLTVDRISLERRRQLATGSSATTSTPPVTRLASRGSNRPAPTSSVEAAPAATAERRDRK